MSYPYMTNRLVEVIQGCSSQFHRVVEGLTLMPIYYDKVTVGAKVAYKAFVSG